MKNLLFAFLMVPALCFAQNDYCNKIKKDEDPSKGTITFRSPELKSLTVIKQFKINTYFYVLIRITDFRPHFDAKDVTVTFADGSILRDAELKIDCTQQGGMLANDASTATSSYSGSYVLQALFPLSGDNISKFTAQTAITVTLDGITKKISEKDGKKLSAFIACMQELHP